MIGKIVQLSYVTASFEAASAHWARAFGVGPFFVMDRPHRRLEQLIYRGAPCEAEFSVALSYWGDLQIEFILQHNDAPSPYLGAEDKGLHHIAALADDIDAAVAQGVAAGAEVILSGTIGGRTRFAYLDFGRPSGVVELMPANPARQETEAYMQACVRDWNGRELLRSL